MATVNRTIPSIITLLFASVLVGFVITVVLYTFPYRVVSYNGPKVCNQNVPTYAMTFVHEQSQALPLQKEAGSYCQGTARYAGFPITEHGRLKASNGQLIDDQAYTGAMVIDFAFWSLVLFAAGLIKRRLIPRLKK